MLDAGASSNHPSYLMEHQCCSKEKHDGSLQICIDYWALNNQEKLSYLTHCILFNYLRAARYFSKMDFRPRYWQVRIAEEGITKTICTTRYCSFELW